MKRKILGLLVCCLLVTGCGEAAATTSTNYAPADSAMEAASAEWDYSDDYYSDDLVDVAMEEASAATVGVTFASNKKIIYRSNVVLETKTYTETYERLVNLIEQYKGYIEYENYNNEKRSYLSSNTGKGQIVIATNNLTIRVPSKNYSTFMKEGLSLGNVLSRNQSIEDKTSEYNTNKSYVDILNDEAEYLAKQLAALENELKEAQANDKHYDDIIDNMKDVASRKAQVEKELVPYKRVMDDIDELVEYSTITMELREVNEFTEIEEEVVVETFGSKVKETWNNTVTTLKNLFQGTLLFLIRVIPAVVYIIFIGVVIGIICMIVKKIKGIEVVKKIFNKDAGEKKTFKGFKKKKDAEIDLNDSKKE